jgi:hypothetical protein
VDIVRIFMISEKLWFFNLQDVMWYFLEFTPRCAFSVLLKLISSRPTKEWTSEFKWQLAEAEERMFQVSKSAARYHCRDCLPGGIRKREMIGFFPCVTREENVHDSRFHKRARVCLKHRWSPYGGELTTWIASGFSSADTPLSSSATKYVKVQVYVSR